MSRNETLLPYVKEKETDLQPTIIVDSREASASPKIVKGLKEAGAEIRVEFLENGDYVLSDLCAVERKTVHDFVYTLTRRYLFEQLFALKEAYVKPLMLIEGYVPLIYKFSKIQPASVWGAMFALVKQGIFLIHTNSYKETIEFLYTAAKQEHDTEHGAPVVRPDKRRETTEESQIFFLAGLPNIGREKAIALLESYKTPLDSLIHVDQWANDVYGLGPKITEKVKQILQTPHKKRGYHRIK